MDDVARIQKINAMSSELKNFGFYDDAQGAVEGATNTFLSEKEQKESKIFSTENQLMEELTNSFGRFKKRTDAQMHEMSNTITYLHSKIEELTNNIFEIQTRKKEEVLAQAETLQSPQMTSEQSQKTEVKTQQPSVQTTMETEGRERSEQTYNERQGHFTSEDVKIEDIFYYGNK